MFVKGHFGTLGKGYYSAAALMSESDSKNHKVVTDAVHENGGVVVMQILHTGRFFISLLFSVIRSLISLELSVVDMPTTFPQSAPRRSKPQSDYLNPRSEYLVVVLLLSRPG